MARRILIITKQINMKKVIFALAIAIFIASCSSSKSTSASNSTTTTSGTQDGSSFENAIVIQEKSEMSGVSAEYKWLKDNYPGYTLISQSLSSSNGKPYDVMNIKTKDGDKKTIYFDISNFFGKY